MVQTLAEATKSNVQEKAKMSPELQKKLVCEEVLDKLGTVKDLYKIDAKNVYYNKWRVDVWTVIWKEGMYGPSYNIKYSYYDEEGALLWYTTTSYEKKGIIGVC